MTDGLQKLQSFAKKRMAKNERIRALEERVVRLEEKVRVLIGAMNERNLAQPITPWKSDPAFTYGPMPHISGADPVNISGTFRDRSGDTATYAIRKQGEEMNDSAAMTEGRWKVLEQSEIVRTEGAIQRDVEAVMGMATCWPFHDGGTETPEGWEE